MNRNDLYKKAMATTSKLLKEKGYICFVDVFMKLGYLDDEDYELWRQKKIPYLEKAIKMNLGKINYVIKTIQKNSINGNLKQCWTAYKSWGKGSKVNLRFSKSGKATIEKLYSTHFLMSEMK